jgi:hypothetical protein
MNPLKTFADALHAHLGLLANGCSTSTHEWAESGSTLIGHLRALRREEMAELVERLHWIQTDLHQLAGAVKRDLLALETKNLRTEIQAYAAADDERPSPFVNLCHAIQGVNAGGMREWAARYSLPVVRLRRGFVLCRRVDFERASAAYAAERVSRGLPAERDPSRAEELLRLVMND